MNDMLRQPLSPSMRHQSLGAQLLGAQWAGGAQLLYLSPLAPLPGAAHRGGVPVLFPQFAYRGPLPKHGFARNCHWDLVEASDHPDHCLCTYRLDVAANTEAGWPYAAVLELQITLRSHMLQMRLEVENRGKESFTWTGGLHPYWAVDQLTDAQIFINRSDESTSNEQQVLGFDGSPVESLYPGGPIQLRANGYTLDLTAKGFDEWMVWTPGREGVEQLQDLPSGDWQRFVCIEPVCVTRPVALGPGQSFVGELLACVALEEK